MLSPKEYVESNIDLILNDLAKLISFKSVYSEDEKPFGKENRKALDFMLKRLNDLGYTTENLDYYAGYGEIGKGEKLIGILAHLDVVNEGEGWLSDPYQMEIRNGNIYGRGATDDKGGLIASFYALNYLKSINYPFKKRVRLIMGCNEESGFKCIEHYVAKKGHIDAGFTPDGHWPGIYGEKGIFRADLKYQGSKIIDIKGGQAVNAVCAKVNLKIKAKDLDVIKFEKLLTADNIKYVIEKENDILDIIVYGVSAHASTPDLGKNALSYLFKALYLADFDDELVKFYYENIGLSVHGENAGLDFKDDFSDLSFNVGMIFKQEDLITLTIDIRFPITLKTELIKEKMFEVFNCGNFNLEIKGSEDPLYYDVNLPFIKAMHKAYQSITNDKTNPMLVIGGGTYAKAINNCIAFGPEFHGVDYHIHDVNEMLPIDELKKNILIYIEAIKNLNEIEL